MASLPPEEVKELLDKNIPRKLHLIWMGKSISKEDLSTLHYLARLAEKSDFAIHLWVDKTSVYSSTAEITDIFPHKIRIRNIKELSSGVTAHPSLWIRKRFWVNVEREMAGLTNYAASSDILRVEILRQEGGYYFDTDLAPVFLQGIYLKKFKIPKAKYGFLCYSADWADYRSQLEPAKSKKKCPDMFRVEINNNVLASYQNHELLTLILEGIFSGYEFSDTHFSDLKRSADATLALAGAVASTATPASASTGSTMPPASKPDASSMGSKAAPTSKSESPWILTLMDIKRSYNKSIPFLQGRKAMTIENSGPNLYKKIISRYIKNKGIEDAYAFAFPLRAKDSKEDAERQRIISMANVEAVCAGRWTKAPKLRRFSL